MTKRLHLGLTGLTVSAGLFAALGTWAALVYMSADSPARGFQRISARAGLPRPVPPPGVALPSKSIICYLEPEPRQMFRSPQLGYSAGPSATTPAAVRLEFWEVLQGAVGSETAVGTPPTSRTNGRAFEIDVDFVPRWCASVLANEFLVIGSPRSDVAGAEDDRARSTIIERWRIEPTPGWPIPRASVRARLDGSPAIDLDVVIEVEGGVLAPLAQRELPHIERTLVAHMDLELQLGAVLADPSGRFALAAVAAPPAVILIDLRNGSGQVSTLLEGASMPSIYELDSSVRLRGKNGAPYFLMETLGRRSTILTETETFGTFDVCTMGYEVERDVYLDRIIAPAGKEPTHSRYYEWFPTKWP